ncbi:PREDICTED: myosin-2 [Ipomoea nil]|uniref:myosin-2 n=1 Tax=Ipomoea nil TaxID=35883 RepID=UPI000900B323|nr:PREDICTED: myosin-2 [Ipomoea nil]XP_019183420.1 PREDICTED: myosin-2 [Ipomoea nil]
MLSVSRGARTRSSLEEMLEALQRRDGDEEKPKDLPPELPSRPRLTAKTRPPSFKRRLPPSFETGNGGLESSVDCDSQKEEVKESRGSSFGAKKVKEMEPRESPYIMSAQRNGSKRRWGENDGPKIQSGLPGSLPMCCEAEWDDSIGYFTKNKLNVWCRQQDGLWESGQIQSTFQEKASVKLSDGSEVVVPTAELLPANPDILVGVDDLIQLSYLNEPSVLHNLQHRYSHERIYSKSGPVLIAVNPFKDVKLYGNEFITAYRQKLVDGPHVYSIADAAYTEMMEDGTNQSIIMSGESGSGKTETGKVAMQYLAALGGGGNGIECKLLQSSCILEAFGNAKTSGNNNSSRFGKLIEIHFSETGKICGAKIQTLLLEESRVNQLAQGERSYHIFYQLCAGAPAGLRAKLKLKRASEYNYLNQTECLMNDVDDAEKFHMLMDALNTVNICKKDQEHAFEMLAAVLWLGNISFEVIDDESHVEAVADEALTNAASLIGCSAHDLMLALSTHRVHVGKDKVTKLLTMQQATDTRNALAKFIYGSLFNWLVDEINKSLAMEKQDTGRSISILDIYGFEAFKNNSFEQFCINYGNERLQQHFNRHLFKLEQEEYESDGIDWIKVEFEDNQECLDLFEKKPTGLISLLDEESNFPEATDLTFASKLKHHLTANRCFKGESGGAFSIQHYAREVLYSTSGFLEKNRDKTLPADIVQLLSSSGSELPRFFASLVNQSQRRSVATKFKGQLFDLMQQLENTTPRFICCIKPNDKQLPGVFEKNLVLKQLRTCGVLDVVKMSRCGYPTRMTHLDFTRRYSLLVDNTVPRDPLSTSVAILQQFNILPEMYRVGYTKLYFRAGQIDALEDARKQVLQGGLEVQKCIPRHRACHHFHELNGGVITLQSFVRGENARRQFNTSKEQLASNKIDEQLVAVIRIQSAIRGCLARKHVSSLRNLKKVILDKCKAGGKMLEVKDLPSEVLPFVIEELQKHLFTSKTTLGLKEKENAALKEQAKQLEAHWSEYEAKMRTMEETWEKQIASLQASLAAAKKSLAADNVVGLPPRCFYDSEGAVGSSQEIDGGLSAIDRLVKEFEQRKHNFDDKATAILQVSSGQLLSTNPEDELRRLKLQFEQWKKEYKVRLRAAKVKVHKLGHSEAERSRRTWWGGKTSKRFQT